jgi:DNA-binding MarR family transcriptional regulator
MEIDDHVSRLIAAWATEMPDVPTAGMSILGRARRVTLTCRPPIEAALRRAGLDTAEFDVLATLRRCGAPYTMRPTEIYDALMISSGGLTSRLAKLQRRRLVRRVTSADDGRSLLVALTDEGRARVERAIADDMAVEEALLDGLDPDEQALLARLLAKLCATLEARAQQRPGRAVNSALVRGRVECGSPGSAGKLS